MRQDNPMSKRPRYPNGHDLVIRVEFRPEAPCDPHGIVMVEPTTKSEFVVWFEYGDEDEKKWRYEDGSHFSYRSSECDHQPQPLPFLCPLCRKARGEAYERAYAEITRRSMVCRFVAFR
jgi:hypothetical protein